MCVNLIDFIGFDISFLVKLMRWYKVKFNFKLMTTCLKLGSLGFPMEEIENGVVVYFLYALN